MIGDRIKYASLGNNLSLIVITIGAVILTRAITVYGLGSLSNWLAKSEIGIPEQTVIWWGGLRGSVAIALALSVPQSIPERNVIIDIIFGVVLFTLLVQGLTTQIFLEKLGLIGDEQPLRQKYLEAVARRIALNRVLNYLSQAKQYQEFDSEYCRYQAELIEGQCQTIELEITQMHQQYPNLRTLVREQLQDQLLSIEADTYAELIAAGRLDNKLSPLLTEIIAVQEENLDQL